MATVTETVHGRRKRTSAVRPLGRLGSTFLGSIHSHPDDYVLLATVASHGLSDGLGTFWSDLNRFARQALLLTLWTAAFMTAINVVMGTSPPMC